MSRVKLIFLPTVHIPQIKFNFLHIVPTLTCCFYGTFLSVLLTIPLLSFIVNSVTKKQKREETAPTKVRSFSIPYNECCKQVLQDLCPNVLRLSRKQSSQCNYYDKKNSLFCKLIRIKTSSKFIFDSYMAKFQPELETCPTCGSCGNCHVHAYYDRSVIDFRKGRKVVDSLCVLHFVCDSCNHTHAILPDVLIPYACHSLMFILRVLGEWFLDRSTIEHLCNRFSITPVQLYKWLKLWKKHKQQWLGILVDFETSDAAFLKSLAISDFYSEFSMPFIQKFACNLSQGN